MTELAQGLFATEASYPLCARFSNSAPRVQPDAVPDGRGLAIQVQIPLDRHADFRWIGAPCIQNFVMVNHPTFIARNVKDYLRLEQMRLKARDNPLRVAGHLLSQATNAFPGRWRELAAGLRIASQLPSHPAMYTYYSMVPIRYGNFVAKYRAAPTSQQLASPLELAQRFATRRDPMRGLLQETLKRQRITFDFQVQLRTSERSMPIEDATIEWPEQESPYRTVAHVIFHQQDLSLQYDPEECERRSFSVWNALTDHRPLGGINRVRRPAYDISAAHRTEKVAFDTGQE